MGNAAFVRSMAALRSSFLRILAIGSRPTYPSSFRRDVAAGILGISRRTFLFGRAPSKAPRKRPSKAPPLAPLADGPHFVRRLGSLFRKGCFPAIPPGRPPNTRTGASRAASPPALPGEQAGVSPFPVFPRQRPGLAVRAGQTEGKAPRTGRRAVERRAVSGRGSPHDARCRKRGRNIKTWTDTLALAAFAILLMLAGCTEDAPGLAAVAGNRVTWSQRGHLFDRFPGLGGISAIHLAGSACESGGGRALTDRCWRRRGNMLRAGCVTRTHRSLAGNRGTPLPVPACRNQRMIPKPATTVATEATFAQSVCQVASEATKENGVMTMRTGRMAGLGRCDRGDRKTRSKRSGCTVISGFEYERNDLSSLKVPVTGKGAMS